MSICGPFHTLNPRQSEAHDERDASAGQQQESESDGACVEDQTPEVEELG